MSIESKTIIPSRSIGGALQVPGDKSISHRVAMLSALASGESTIRGFLMSEDCLHTLRAVEELGAGVVRDGDEIRIRGTAGCLLSPGHPLDMGNSGTGMRLLSGVLAGQPFSCEMTGDESLCSRPMKRIKDPLEQMGARVELLGDDGRPPIRAGGGELRPICYHLPVASAQVKSCVLLAGLAVKGAVQVLEPRACRDHTELMMKAMGANLEVDGTTITLHATGSRGSDLRGRAWCVPGDLSSAAFWIVAAALKEGAELTITNVGLNPRRTALLDVLLRMGADITCRLYEDSADGAPWEPVGSVEVRGRQLHGTDVCGDEIPNLIDELPLVALAGALAQGTMVIRDAAELRVKESDRIASMAANLRLLGVAVEEADDGMTVQGGAAISGGVTLDSYGDHRIAMAMAIAGLFANDPVQVDNVACVATSYPGFWDDLQTITQRS